MNNNYKTHSTTNPYLDLVRKHDIPYMTNVLNKEIIVYPNVMSPEYDWSSRFYIEKIPNQKNKSFLEIGSGSGVVSTFIGFQKPKKVVATDINPDAIVNTRENFKKYNLENTKVLTSDLFEKISEKFNTIFFNAPYHGNEPQDMLERGVSDKNYEVLKGFLKNAKNFLEENGDIYLGFSDTGDNDLLKSLILENRYLLVERIEETNEGWTAYLYHLKPIKFENKYIELFFDDNIYIFKKYESLIKTGKVLYVGHGNGQAVYAISLWNQNIVGLDILKHKNSLAQNKMVLYNGEKIPFEDNSFETVICNYTLHHTSNPQNVLKELVRVSGKNIIIVEETYKNIFQKISLVFNDWLVNKIAGQVVTIFWNSYFSKKNIRNIFLNNSLQIIKEVAEKRKCFEVEFFILKK